MIEVPIRGRLLLIPHPSPRVKIEGALTYFDGNYTSGLNPASSRLTSA